MQLNTSGTPTQGHHILAFSLCVFVTGTSYSKIPYQKLPNEGAIVQ